MTQGSSLSLRALIGLCCVSNVAWGLGPDGAVLQSSDYNIDFHQGPVLQSSRIIGLAGSIAPLAEGIIGAADNPASVVVRVPWSRSWYDWDVDASISSPSAVIATDFDNNGTTNQSDRNAAFVTLGGALQFGRFGLGLHVDVAQHQVGSRAAAGDGQELTVTRGRVNFVVGYLFLDGQLAVGVGAGTYVIDISPSNQTDGDAPSLAAVQSGTLQFGGIWAPHELPVRAGASLRAAAPADDAVPEGVMPDADGNYVAEGYYFPARIEAPTVLQFAVATQFFRRLNGPWLQPPPLGGAELPLESTHRPPDFVGRRGHLLISAALEVTLPTKNAVGIESFLTQRVQRSGRTTSFSPRLGIEGEPWVNGLIVRGGTYLEPTRFAASSARLHGTAGVDIHIPLTWSVFGLLDDDTSFRIGGAVDRARDYFGWSASLGVWH